MTDLSPYAFGAASVWGVGLSYAAWRLDAHRFGDLLACSGLLATTWTISFILTQFYSPPNSWIFYPVMDAAVGGAVMFAWFSKRARWKLVLVLLFLLQCIMHVAFWLHRERPYSVQWTYAFFLDLTFALQLLTVAWPGGAHVAAWIVHLHHRPADAHGNHPARPWSP